MDAYGVRFPASPPTKQEVVMGDENWMTMVAVKWQPIETAPKDGSPILVTAGAGVVLVTFDEGLPDYCPWAVVGASQISIGAVALKHWMPAPTPPKVG